MNTLKLLEKTVKDGKEYQSRWRWEVEGNPEWQIMEGYWKSSEAPEKHYGGSATRHPGKLIIVERTYTERIVASYDISPEGNLTPIRKES
jgi:hypothetical protein